MVGWLGLEPSALALEVRRALGRFGMRRAVDLLTSSLASSTGVPFQMEGRAH